MAPVPGEGIEVERTVDLRLEVEAERGGVLVLAQAASVRARLRLTVVESDPDELTFDVAFSQLELRLTSDAAHDAGGSAGRDAWALPPSAAPLRLRARCDRRGRLRALDGSLEAVTARIGAGRLARLAGLYLFGARAGERGERAPDGALAGAGLPFLPDPDAGPEGGWSCEAGGFVGLRHGLTGEAREVLTSWVWRIAPPPEGPADRPAGSPATVALRGALTAVAVAPGPAHLLTVYDGQGVGTAAIDPATGFLVAATLESSFAFEGAGKDEDTYRGRWTRRDTLARVDSPPAPASPLPPPPGSPRGGR